MSNLMSSQVVRGFTDGFTKVIHDRCNFEMVVDDHARLALISGDVFQNHFCFDGVGGRSDLAPMLSWLNAPRHMRDSLMLASPCWAPHQIGLVWR